MNEDLRIDILKQRLIESDIPASERDALADDLEFAASINGDSDPTRQMMKRMFISGVRREMMAHAKITAAVELHASKCALRVPAPGDWKAELRKSIAANMRVIVIVAGVSITILGVSIVVTRQISEAAGFVTTAAQAANRGK